MFLASRKYKKCLWKVQAASIGSTTEQFWKCKRKSSQNVHIAAMMTHFQWWVGLRARHTFRWQAVQPHSTRSASACHREVQYSVFCGAEIYCANLIVLITEHLNRWHQKLYIIEYEYNLITYCISQQIKGFNLSNSSHHIAKNTENVILLLLQLFFKPYGFGTNVRYKKDAPCWHLSNDISFLLFKFIIWELRENHLVPVTPKWADTNLKF
jgi:hypothetical protein